MHKEEYAILAPEDYEDLDDLEKKAVDRFLEMMGIEKAVVTAIMVAYLEEVDDDSV